MHDIVDVEYAYDFLGLYEISRRNSFKEGRM